MESDITVESISTYWGQPSATANPGSKFITNTSQTPPSKSTADPLLDMMRRSITRVGEERPTKGSM